MSELRIIPAPNEWKLSQRFTMEVKLPLVYIGECEEENLFELEKDRTGKAVLFLMQSDDMPEEGYQLEIDADKIVLHYGTDAGRFYGLVTLFQMIREGKGEISCGVIADSPRYEYRGFMLDVSRHFFSVEEIKKILNEMAMVKMNRFHWHLSDDQGFRIESLRFPKLNSVGAKRTETDGRETCDYYTQDQIREIVAYAQERKIMVIPEIDLPGHTSAIVAAYPEFSCDGTPAEVKTAGGIYTHIISPCKPAVLTFLYDLLDEVCALFPGDYFHIGGDEAPKTEWEQDPMCQAFIREEGLKDMEQLQGWLTKKLMKHLDSLGKTTIGWNEMLNAGPMEDAIGQYWMEFGPETKIGEAIASGQTFIFSPNSCCYCDYPYAMVTLRGTYGFEPEIKGKKIDEEQVLGLECPLWSERIEKEDHLEKQIFPRIQALAENGWTIKKDFDDFKKRMAIREAYLQESGISFTHVEEADVHGEEGLKMLEMQMRAMAGAMSQGGKIEMPEEMKQTIAASIDGMFRENMQYAFTKEEIDLFLGKVKTELMQL